MKQIGYRQEAAKVGGIGSCGRELCCSTWLTDFRSVNTAAARYQQLSINPQKLAGQCGKLKCCLNYELDSYLDALDEFPSMESTFETEKGTAYCVKIDVFKKEMWFTSSSGGVSWYKFSLDQAKSFIDLSKNGGKTASLEDLAKESIETEKKSFTDVIEENSLERFERKNKNRNKNRKNKPKDSTQKTQPQGNKPNRDNKKPQGNKPNKKQSTQGNKEGQPQMKKEGDIQPKKEGQGQPKQGNPNQKPKAKKGPNPNQNPNKQNNKPNSEGNQNPKPTPKPKQQNKPAGDANNNPNSEQNPNPNKQNKPKKFKNRNKRGPQNSKDENQ